MLDITWILTSISLIGTIFNIRKKIICFYIWLIGDICWFTLDFTSEVYGRATLDLFLDVEVSCHRVQKINDFKLNSFRDLVSATTRRFVEF